MDQPNVPHHASTVSRIPMRFGLPLNHRYYAGIRPPVPRHTLSGVYFQPSFGQPYPGVGLRRGYTALQRVQNGSTTAPKLKTLKSNGSGEGWKRKYEAMEKELKEMRQELNAIQGERIEATVGTGEEAEPINDVADAANDAELGESDRILALLAREFAAKVAEIVDEVKKANDQSD